MGQSTLLLCVLLSAIFLSTSATSESSSDPVGRFKTFLRIATVHPNPDYKPSTDFLLAQAKEVGLEAQIFEYVKEKPVVVLTWKGKDPSLPTILLNSHVDVVPAEKSKWVHDPFAAVQVWENSINRGGFGLLWVRGLLRIFEIPRCYEWIFCKIKQGSCFVFEVVGSKLPPVDEFVKWTITLSIDIAVCSNLEPCS